MRSYPTRRERSISVIHLWSRLGLQSDFYAIKLIGFYLALPLLLLSQAHAFEMIASPHTYPHGLTTDGTQIWSADYTNRQISTLDLDGNVTGSFYFSYGSPRGLAYHSGTLYVATGSKVYKVNASTGAYIGEFNSPDPSPSHQGLAYGDGKLWIASTSSDRIYGVDPNTGSSLVDFPSPGSSPRGLTYKDGILWNLDSSSDRLYGLSPTNGSILAASPCPLGGSRGLTTLGNRFVQADPDVDALMTFERADTYMTVFRAPNDFIPEGSSYKLPYMSSHPLNVPNGDIKRILFMQHGISDNAVPYFARAHFGARLAGKLDETLIISLQLVDDGKILSTPPSDMLYWVSGRFWGAKSASSSSTYPRSEQFSAYELLDEMLSGLTTDTSLFPQLEQIVVSGHSGGGQFANRYAATSRFESEILPAERNIDVRYIVMNPSSYVYMSHKRYNPATLDLNADVVDFIVPSAPPSGYNSYGYGLEALSNYAYPNTTTAPVIQSQYPGRDVVYLLGEADTTTGSLDVTEKAMTQGDNRYERGQIYFKHVQNFASENSLIFNHQFDSVPGVGHDGRSMIISTQGRQHHFPPTNTNATPVASNSNATTDEDTAVVITLSASDPDGDTLTYTIVSGPTNGSLSGIEASRTYTPNPGFSGSDSFTFKANDGTVDSNTATVSITIIPAPNTAPNVDAGLDQTITLSEGAKSWTPAEIATTVWFDAADATTITVNGESVSQWADKSGHANHAVQTDLTHQPTFDSVSGKVDFDGNDIMQVTNDPFKGLQNFAVIAVQKWSSNAGWHNVTASFHGEAGNGWQARQHGTGTVCFTIRGTSATDDPGTVNTNNLEFLRADYRKNSATRVQRVDGTEASTLTDTGDIPYTGNNRSALGGRYQGDNWSSQTGYLKGYMRELIVIENPTDDDVLKAEGYLAHKWELEANLPSDHPYKSAAPGGNGNEAIATLTGTASDPDGDPLATSWSKLSGEGTASFSDTSALTTTVTFDTAGTYVLRLSADDGSDLSSDDVTITVNTPVMNTGPVASDDSIVTTEDTAIAISLSATDAEGDALNYTVVNGPSNGTLSGIAPDLIYTPIPGYFGADSFDYFADDSQLVSNVATINITVQEVVIPVSDIGLNSGLVTNVDDTWQTVILPRAYSSMVVIATPLYTNAQAPAVPRIRNAYGNGFDIKLQNPGGQSSVTPSTVHYVVVEEGVYNLEEHGLKMEAVKYTSTVTDNKSSWVGESRTFANSYTSPTVFGQVMTDNDGYWSVFWCKGNNRSDGPSSTAFYTGKSVLEDTNKTRMDEVIGYIVIEAGSFSTQGKTITAATGNDTVQGMGDAPSYSYSVTTTNNLESVVLGIPGFDGIDGAWPVLYETPDGSSLKLAADEDLIGDSERRHTTEPISYLIIESNSPQ